MSFGGHYTRTPGSYDFNGMLVSPNAAGDNPYGDPSDETNPSQALAAQWAFQNQGDATEVGSDFNATPLALYLASMVAAGASPGVGGAGAAELGGAPTGTSALATAGGLTPTVGLPASLPGSTFLSAEGVPLMAGETAGVAGGTGATAAQLAGSGGTLSRLGQALNAGSRMVGAAENANAHNQGLENDYGFNSAQAANEWARNMAQLQQQNAALGLQANTANNNAALGGYEANTAGQSAFQNELLNRSKLEQDQRNTGIRNLFKMSAAKNPSRGPFDQKGPPALDPQYVSTLQAVGNQASDMLAKGPTYDAATMPAPTWTPYAAPTPYTLPPMTVPTYTAPPAWQGPNTGTLARIGEWAGPALGLLSSYYGGR